MRKPRPQDFEPNYKKPKETKPEPVDLTGVVAIKPREIGDEIKENPPTDHDTMQPSNHATTVSSDHATMIEVIRKAVKVFGKEAATYRFTEEEKRALDDLEYSYKRQGIRTSENELTRIAVNFLIEDHMQNGANSILDQVLKALND